MKYVLKNIKSFFITEKIILFLVCLCVITSAVIINFSYGLYQNYNVVKEEANSEFKEIAVIINDNNAVTKAKLKNCLFSFSSNTNETVDMYLVFPIVDEFYSMQDHMNRLMCRFTIDDNKIKPSSAFEKVLKDQGDLIEGDYFTDEQETKGELVAIVRPEGDFDADGDCTKLITTRVEGDKRWVKIQNKEYEVIGYHKQLATPFFPFESLDESTTMQDFIDIMFSKPITISQYNDVRNNFESTFGDAVTVPDMDIPEAENYYLYNTIIVISILIALLAAINFAVLYKYILSKRTKKLAIFRMCGCTKLKTFNMFITECMLLMIPLFLITTLVYDKIILPKLGAHFEYMESAYSAKLYLLIFAIYTVVSFVVLSFMISKFLKKSIREAKEEK
jgi:ABC-type antimicrobial peptide transport system permease subunit